MSAGMLFGSAVLSDCVCCDDCSALPSTLVATISGITGNICLPNPSTSYCQQFTTVTINQTYTLTKTEVIWALEVPSSGTIMSYYGFTDCTTYPPNRVDDCDLYIGVNCDSSIEDLRVSVALVDPTYFIDSVVIGFSGSGALGTAIPLTIDYLLAAWLTTGTITISLP